MKGQTPLFSKANNEWETPNTFFDILNTEFEFDIDAAANQYNTKCKFYFDDALNLPVAWNNTGVVYNEKHPNKKHIFLNPPYSLVELFLKQAYEESKQGAIIVCLIPTRSDTGYWHKYCMEAYEIRFVKGRLKFTNRTKRADEITSATFPSSVIIFDEQKKQLAQSTQKEGTVWHPIISSMERGVKYRGRKCKT